MANKTLKVSSRALARIAAVALAGASLAGCVYYPSGYGYAPGYYAEPAYVAPAPVVVGGWWGWGGHGHWHGHG
ncbi:MAG TPA: hypothetical protein VLT37_09790 [Acidocella sp.]|nr:hypothetical protein [Acidocella sp.]